ncbi:MAG: hypothetical protein ACO3ZG_07150 [Kiritimatiellia bacterium]|jgi:hypothetical protein
MPLAPQHPTLQSFSYGGWSNCLRLSDGQTEAVITLDVGPRIIRYGFVGAPNILKEFPEQLGKCGGMSWRIYGGHRLWVAPEDPVLTCVPDNEPVTFTWRNKQLTIHQPADRLTGMAKELRLRYLDQGALRIDHRLINQGGKAVNCAPWALTVMASGGEAVVPQEPFVPHPKALLPARPLVLWPYTNMKDPRWSWGEKEIRLRQRPHPSAQKMGCFSAQGWMAYHLKKQVMIKHHPVKGQPGDYPDHGCNLELFTNADILEMESLGPMTRLKSGARVDHREVWSLHHAATRPDIATLTAWAKRAAP